MMELIFNCPVCRRELRGKHRAAGKIKTCPACKANVRVPQLNEQPQEGTKIDGDTARRRDDHKPSGRPEALYVAAAAVLTIGVIVTIEMVVVGHLHFEATAEGFFGLELVAVSVLLGAFVFGEFLKGFGFLTGRSQHSEMKLRDIGIIFLVIVVSLVIYGVTAELMASPGEKHESAHEQAGASRHELMLQPKAPQIAE